MNSLEKFVHLVMYVMFSFHMSNQLHFPNTIFSIEVIFGKLMKYYNPLTSNVPITFIILFISCPLSLALRLHAQWRLSKNVSVKREGIFMFLYFYVQGQLVKLLSGIFWVCTCMSHVLETAHQESWNSGMLMIREYVMREAHCEAWEDIQTCSPGKQLLVTEINE